MIKICYIIGQLNKGGAERQLYELVKGINREKFNPIVISLGYGEYWSREIRKLDIPVIELKRKRKDLTIIFKLIKQLKAIRPDIVHGYMFTANFYGRIAAIIARTPIIIASKRQAEEAGKDKEKYQVWIYKLLVPFTHAIICNSLRASETLVKKYAFNPEKVFTVHNGINVIETNINSQKKLAPIVVGTVGSLTPKKNHRLFLDMAKNVLERTKSESIKFAIVGEGVLRDELEKYSQQLGIENKVLFAGEKDDIPNFLQSIDIFVMTSLYEGLPNALMEAMAVELPVVASDIGGNNELVIDGETGFLCPSDDARAFAESVIGLINNEDEAKQMGENGKKRILSEFGVEKMITETENIYMKLLEQENILTVR